MSPVDVRWSGTCASSDVQDDLLARFEMLAERSLEAFGERSVRVLRHEATVESVLVACDVATDSRWALAEAAALGYQVVEHGTPAIRLPGAWLHGFEFRPFAPQLPGRGDRLSVVFLSAPEIRSLDGRLVRVEGGPGIRLASPGALRAEGPFAAWTAILAGWTKTFFVGDLPPFQGWPLVRAAIRRVVGARRGASERIRDAIFQALLNRFEALVQERIARVHDSSTGRSKCCPMCAREPGHLVMNAYARSASYTPQATTWFARERS